MDEQQLAEAMRGAAADVPPASFDSADVVLASRRITARRRAVTAGAALAAVVVVGVGVSVGVGVTGSRDATTAAAPAEAPAVPQYAPSPAPEAARAAPPAAADAHSSGAESAPSPQPPLGPGPVDTCANPQDPQLRALVEEVLPEVAGAPEAPTTKECRLGGGRGVNVEVAGGVLSVTYLPPGAPTGSAPARGVVLPTASGGTLVMVASGSGPSPERLAEAAVELAPRL
ncbi:MAG: hypothetical protein AB7V44_13415 [Pseudonocardia sp.]